METWVIMTLVLAVTCYFVETGLISLCIHNWKVMLSYLSD